MDEAQRSGDRSRGHGVKFVKEGERMNERGRRHREFPAYGERITAILLCILIYWVSLHGSSYLLNS